jgi:ADP-ribosylarginine hydrolase
MINKKEKIEAAIMIASYLDTIGFFNGQWEFNYGGRTTNITSALIDNFTIVNHFMALGGFNYINIKGWLSSDDTILIITIIKSLLDGGKELDFIKNYLNIYEELANPKRISGIQTLRSINYLKKIIQKKKDSYLDLIPFDNLMSGNGAAIRSGPIGIYFSDDIDKLIETAIISSRLTHNIPIAYLGGLISALFASYAFKNIESKEWINELLKLYESNKIINYIRSTDIGNKHDKEIENYFMVWYKYREERYNDIINYRLKSTFIFAKERLESLSEYSPKDFFTKNKNENWNLIGASGLDSVIYAYDSLLMSIVPNEKTTIYNPETFLFYSSLHIGDSDSTGAIAGFWYGALLGYNGFDKNKIKNLEYYNKLQNLADKFVEAI